MRAARRAPNGRVSPAAEPTSTSPQGYVENFDDTLLPLLRRFKPAISGYGSLRQVQTLVRRLLVRLSPLPFEAGGERTHFPDQPSLLFATRVQTELRGRRAPDTVPNNGTNSLLPQGFTKEQCLIKATHNRYALSERIPPRDGQRSYPQSFRSMRAARRAPNGRG